MKRQKRFFWEKRKNEWTGNKDLRVRTGPILVVFIKFGTFIMNKVFTIMTQNTVIMHDFIGTDTTVYFTIPIFLFYNFVIPGSARHANLDRSIVKT